MLINYSLHFFFNKSLKMFFMMNLLSMGGLPPFTGLFPKWMLINLMIYNNQFFMLLILMMFSLITLFYYLRLTYSALMLNYSENNWNNSMFINFKLNMLIMTMTLFNLTLMPLYFML